jgi:formylglycine-generating enzyme required for sulfatase activity
VPATGTAERPVTGIRPADATRFAAWRSEKESARVRLPTDAEWLLAGGGPLRALGRGDLAVDLDPKAVDVPSLWEAPCELTVAIRPKEEAAAFRRLGRAAAKTSVEEAMGDTRDLAEDARDAAIGFRCVRELP